MHAPSWRGETFKTLTFDPRLTQYGPLSQDMGTIADENGRFQVILRRC
jgi:hypothetical protein